MKKILLLTCLLCATLQVGFAKKKPVSDYNLKKAVELLEEQDYTKGMEYVTRHLEEYPNDADALAIKAGFHTAQNEYGKALSALNQAIAHHCKTNIGSKNDLYVLRADIYANSLKQVDAAIADYTTALKLTDKKDIATLQSILHDRAQLYYGQKNYAAADADYNRCLQYDATNQSAMAGLARNRLDQERYEEALDLLDKCETYDANYSETYRFRLQVYHKMGKVDKAIDDAISFYDKEKTKDDYLMSVLKKHPSYSIAKISEQIKDNTDNALWRLLLAQVYESVYDYPHAIATYNDLEKEYGIYPQFYYYRSRCYNEIGDMEQAVTDITKCIDMEDDKDYFSIILRADYYREGGMYDEAIADFTTGIELKPTEAYPYYKRGWCYELSGDDESAMKDYNAGIDIDKNYPYIYLMRGELYLKQGNTEKAKADFDIVHKKDTVANSGSCRQYALHFLDRDAEAIEWMEKIIAEDSARAGGYYDKSCLLALMNRLEESVEALRKSFSLGYRSFAHIEHDDDMDPIRERDDFKALIEEYKNKPLYPELKKEEADTTKTEIVSEIQMKKLSGGVYEVPCTINELPLKFIFDTGASKVALSSVEANFMMKNGYLTEKDILGKDRFSTATGEIHEGTTIRLHNIKVGDVTLRNVDASVVHNQQAPLLLGQSVLERFGTITIDNENSKLIIKQK